MKTKSKNKIKNISNINSAYACNADNWDGTFCEGKMKLEGNVYVCNKCGRWEYSSS